MVLEPVILEKPKLEKPEVIWKAAKKLSVLIEESYMVQPDGKPCSNSNGFRLTYVNNRIPNETVIIERIDSFTLMHDFGHILLALTNDDHHPNSEI